MIVKVGYRITDKELKAIKAFFTENDLEIADCSVDYSADISADYSADISADYSVSINKTVGKRDRLFLIRGNTVVIDPQAVLALPGVEDCIRISLPYISASRDSHPADTVVKVGNVSVGGGEFTVIAGPCSVESYTQIKGIASVVKRAGGSVLRGGAWKPRSSPYYFQGLKAEAIEYLEKAGKEVGIPVVSEIVRLEDLPLFIEKTDLIQVGARNMQNYELLKALGKTKKPILLKRGPAATITDLLLSAEYILAEGNDQVILCERGIRTFETATRYTLDLGAVGIIKKLSHLPIIVDPSHAAGDYRLVPGLALAAVAAGADGLMIEVHDHPKQALSDGRQALKTEKLAELIEKCRNVFRIVNDKQWKN